MSLVVSGLVVGWVCRRRSVCRRKHWADYCGVHVVRRREDMVLLLLSVGGTMQCIVVDWPGDDTMRSRVVRATSLAGMVARKG